jgi:hypothetical protein
LRNPMRHPFQTYTFHMHYASEACWFGIVLFWTASKCPRERAYDETPGSDLVENLVVES